MFYIVVHYICSLYSIRIVFVLIRDKPSFDESNTDMKTTIPSKPKSSPKSSTGTMSWIASALTSTFGLGTPTYSRTETMNSIHPQKFESSPPPIVVVDSAVSDHDEEDDEYVDAQEEDSRNSKTSKVQTRNVQKNRRLGQKKWANSNDLDTEVLVEGLNGPATQPVQAVRGKVGADSYLAAFVDDAALRKEQVGPIKHSAFTNEKFDNSVQFENHERVSASSKSAHDYIYTSVKHEAECDVLPLESPRPSLSNQKSCTMSNNADQTTPLAEGWEEVRAPTGELYYYHKKTRVSR